MGIRFRRAQSQDANTVLGLMRGLYTHYDMTHPPQAEAALRQVLASGDHAYIWLLEDDECVAGYVVLSFGFTLEFGGRYGFIDELYVAPERRRQGLGAQALTFIEDEARHLGLGALFLEADRDGQDVQRFYRRHGYAGRRYELLFKRLED